MKEVLYVWSAESSTCPGKYPMYYSSNDREARRVLRICSICGTDIETHEGPVGLDLEGGREWPDMLSGITFPKPIVSQRVIDTLNEVYPLPYYPIEIDSMKLTKLSAADAPDYYYLMVPRGVNMDLERSGIKAPHCPECGSFDGPSNEHFYALRMDTWNGEMIVSERDSRFPARAYCTIKWIQISRKERFSNFMFLPTEKSEIDAWKNKIKYLGRKWPPKAD